MLGRGWTRTEGSLHAPRTAGTGRGARSFLDGMSLSGRSLASAQLGSLPTPRLPVAPRHSASTHSARPSTPTNISASSSMASKVPNLLVIGGNGFVGSTVCRKAVQRGWNVTSISQSGRPWSSPSGHTPAWVDKVSAWARSLRWAASGGVAFSGVGLKAPLVGFAG